MSAFEFTGGIPQQIFMINLAAGLISPVPGRAFLWWLAIPIFSKGSECPASGSGTIGGFAAVPAPPAHVMICLL
jgi:hypothetical protein